MTKSQLVAEIADLAKLQKSDVANVLDALCELATRELQADRAVVVPGLVKLSVVNKPATKPRQGRNPATGEPMMFKAKPARRAPKARLLKALKDAV